MELELMAKPHDSLQKNVDALTSSNVSLFAEKALRKVPRQGLRARCIDGRYPEGSVAIAMPGGDAGLLAAGLGLARRFRGKGLEISNEAVRDAVFFVIGGKENFNYHTDEHALEHSGAAYEGCGHCRLLAGDPDSYFLDKKQVDFFRKTIEDLKTEGIEPDVLSGRHEERAVIVVSAVGGDDDSVWTLDGQAELEDGVVQAFIYNETLAEERFAALAKALADTSSEAKAREDEIKGALFHIANTQLQRTRESLAKGLPVYLLTVRGSTGKFSIEKTL